MHVTTITKVRTYKFAKKQDEGLCREQKKKEKWSNYIINSKIKKMLFPSSLAMRPFSEMVSIEPFFLYSTLLSASYYDCGYIVTD